MNIAGFLAFGAGDLDGTPWKQRKELPRDWNEVQEDRKLYQERRGLQRDLR